MMMKLRPAILAMAVVAGLGACEDEEDDLVFRATLSGANEHPVRNSPASGTAQFRIGANNTITYTVDVQNLSNITAGHIHGPAAATADAGVIIALFATPPTTSPFSGRLAEGTITAATTLPGMDLDSLIALFENGNSYVNLHTNDGVAPTNTGPGDFPAGEIRGQILRAP